MAFIIAIDPATVTGYACRHYEDESAVYGSLRLAGDDPEAPDYMRLYRARAGMLALLRRARSFPIYVLMEGAAGFTRGAAQVALSHKIRGAMESALGEITPRPRLITLQPHVVKVMATGDAKADKDAVIRAVRSRGYDVRSDDEADALAMLGWALDQGEDGLLQSVERMLLERKRKRNERREARKRAAEATGRKVEEQPD